MLQLITTGDGSKTLFNPEIGENYHSKHGALQESRHVFLKSGLVFFLSANPVKTVHVLEIGFGTGLNFLLTAEYCTQNQIQLHYTGIEAFPLSETLIAATDYNQYISPEIWESFLHIYPDSLTRQQNLNNCVQLQIAHTSLLNFKSHNFFDVLYFDAFAAVHQPEMWTNEALSSACTNLKKGGVFVTYAITGNLKRSMKSLGFGIEKAPGAPGKREMLRATKL
ncbi:tRNA (5-methylaminomethyl-2-thiouridine)(34)-methyltransferase MnmD [Rubrolithibacter danxiaensis]|uniref:tRNA (5-methylaminomethyl-2-thiouridine)(34)-methyltransferase MnmD n=1 Tax=Rubrolithibacter danxiaensis TaxID=3390805 RepID=UPI003BF8F0FF